MVILRATGKVLRYLPKPEAPEQEAAERAAMEPVRVAKTADRSVLGILVDYAYHVPHHLGPDPTDDRVLHFAEHRLQGIPWNATQKAKDVVFPAEKTVELLRERWR